jgi:hypothetical protein
VGLCRGGTAIRVRSNETHVLRGAKIALFLLSVLFATVLMSGIFTRPTQAEFFDTVVTCVLNIGNCKVPPEGTPDPAEDPIDPSDENPDSDDPPVLNDATDPALTLYATPMLAGGTTETVTITGSVEDENLQSYSLAVNGVTAQQESGVTDKKVDISIPWSVSTPERLSSGMYTVTLDAIDKADNTAHIEVVVEVDNDGPLESVSGGDVIIKGGSITPNVEASDAHNPLGFQWIADEKNPGALDFDASASQPTFTPKIEGSYTFYVDISDGLGNVSHDEFTFGYARQLETVPLPVADDPTDTLVVSSPSTPTITPASTSPTSRSGRDEITASDDADVLGNTITSAGQKSSSTTTTIIPTDKGWSIFGMLWYWWLIIVAGIVVAWRIVKKIVASRVPEKS